MARVNEQTDDEIVPWIDGFVENKSYEVAKYLLAGVGQLE